jgi:ABC-type transporter Mla MlaB component
MSMSSVHRIQPEGTTGHSPAAATRRRLPGTLDLSIHRRGAVVELALFGELDMATAPHLAQAMAWLRACSGAATTIVIDTSGVDFIAAAGYHALQAALVRPDGLWDPHVALVVGPVLTRFEAAISAGQRQRPAGGSAQLGPPR